MRGEIKTYAGLWNITPENKKYYSAKTFALLDLSNFAHGLKYLFTITTVG